MKEKKVCSNCGMELRFLRREDIQLGKSGFFRGIWTNLMAGALRVGIWCCPGCGKLDFYLARPDEELGSGDGISRIRCPDCGAEYDLDCPKCPNCGAKNIKW